MKSSDKGDDAQRAFDLSIGAHYEHITPEAWPLTACFCDLFAWDLKHAGMNGTIMLSCKDKMDFWKFFSLSFSQGSDCKSITCSNETKKLSWPIV